MASYNGFDTDFRKKVGNEQRRLMYAGKFPDWRQQPCEMCGTRAGTIMCHLENYYNKEEYNPLCVECHLKLHGRFRNPKGWIAHLIDIRDGYQSKGFASVNDYFSSKENKDYFAVTKNYATFVPSPDRWFEMLKLVEEDLREYFKNQGIDGRSEGGVRNTTGQGALFNGD